MNFRRVRSAEPTAADVQKVREQVVTSREIGLKTNGFWASNFASRDLHGEDIAGLLDAYDEMVNGLTGKQIQEAARKYFDMKRYVKVVLLPAGRCRRGAAKCPTCIGFC